MVTFSIIIVVSFSVIIYTLEQHEQATQHYRPLLDGVRYMTDKELSEMLKVSRHTLQQYRNKGLIPFTYCQGKVLYKEQDVQELLERNYQPAKWSST